MILAFMILVLIAMLICVKEQRISLCSVTYGIAACFILGLLFIGGINKMLTYKVSVVTDRIGNGGDAYQLEGGTLTYKKTIDAETSLIKRIQYTGDVKIVETDGPSRIKYRLCHGESRFPAYITFPIPLRKENKISDVVIYTSTHE